MRKKTVPIIILSAFLLSGKCTHEKSPNVPNRPIVCCYGRDNSETMVGYPVLNEEQIETTCNVFNSLNSDICFAIENFGNPSHEGFKRLILDKAPIIDPKATMSNRVKQRKAAEKIKNTNESRIKSFLSAYSYNHTKDAKTCLNEFCDDAVMLLKEPQFDDYMKIVCIYSDGYPDNNGDNIPESLTCSFPDDVTLCTIGWKNPEKIKHAGKYYEFTDMNGFISYLKTLTKSEEQ